MRVGSNWLNKIGALVFVIGLALLVGYSMTHVGPVGRVTMGFVIASAMLGVGIALERRPEYRNYAYGLIAGGWAGVYFTTYAMHGVEAARVVESPLVAISLLTIVAAGMLAHSLRYRSEVVSALAFLVAYATLALTPLSAFALAAALPLAICTVFVAGRRDWSGVSVLAVVGTYGLFVFSDGLHLRPGESGVSPASLTPYLALGAYWLVFEVADIAALKRRRAVPKVPLMLLNGAGLIGAGLLRLPATPEPITMFLAAAGVAYLASAVARARLAGRISDPRTENEIVDAAYGTHQGAVIIAAAAMAWAVAIRFDGARETLGLLVEAEWLVLSGLLLKDWIIRGCGAVAAILATASAFVLLSDSSAPIILWAPRFHTFVPVLLLMVLVWYANRETLRARGITPLVPEWVYAPAATWLLISVASKELTVWHASLVTLALAFVLVEAGFRRGREYWLQAAVAFSGAALSLVLVFVLTPITSVAFAPTERDAWSVLPAAALLAFITAWRIAPKQGETGPHRRARVIGAAWAQFAGLAFIVTLEWIVVDPRYVGMTWAATAMILLAAGLGAKISGLRWQAYPLLLLAFLFVMNPVVDLVPNSAIQVWSAGLVIGLMYAAALAVRAAIARGSGIGADVEDAVRIVMLLASTGALGLLLYREVRSTAVTLAWGLESALLLAAGFMTRERVLRLCGLAILLVCLVRLFAYDLAQLEGLARILSFVALGLVLLGVSWVYTKYQSAIRKFL